MATCPAPPASSYVAPSLVTAFNSIPHIDIDLNTVPDTFELSLDYFEVSSSVGGRCMRLNLYSMRFLKAERGRGTMLV